MGIPLASVIVDFDPQSGTHMNVFRRAIARVKLSCVIRSRACSAHFLAKLRIAGLNSIYLCSCPLFTESKMAAPVQVVQEDAQVKPPNVLVLQPHKDSTTQEFSQIRDALESCLTPERYVVYPLGLEEIRQSSPWRDNCRLLVVPPRPFPSNAAEHAQSIASGGDGTGMNETVPRMSEKVLQEITSYVGRGGALLSMHPDVNKMFGLDLSSKIQLKHFQQGICNVTPKSNESSKSADKWELDKFNTLHISEKQSHDQISGVELTLETGIVSHEDLAVLTPIETDAALEWLDANTNQSNNIESEQSSTTPQSLQESEEDVSSESGPTCVRSLELEQGGKAILSCVNLFPLVRQDLRVKALVWLKRGVEQRRRFLSSLLFRLGLECSEEKVPELTHTYLVCSGEVRCTYNNNLCLRFNFNTLSHNNSDS